MNKKQRMSWSTGVYHDLVKWLKDGDHIYFHAGAKYREFLTPMLQKHYRCHVPLEGLGIGQQLGWYKSYFNEKGEELWVVRSLELCHYTRPWQANPFKFKNISKPPPLNLHSCGVPSYGDVPPARNRCSLRNCCLSNLGLAHNLPGASSAFAA